mmetsp:Transcript_37410/g.115350  ORF Transcript_37410/g.115350 Transcript_37410/m.115350 type:complete len:436 (-) Transcript_37410:22-1329(-)
MRQLRHLLLMESRHCVGSDGEAGYAAKCRVAAELLQPGARGLQAAQLRGAARHLQQAVREVDGVAGRRSSGARMPEAELHVLIKRDGHAERGRGVAVQQHPGTADRRRRRQRTALRGGSNLARKICHQAALLRAQRSFAAACGRGHCSGRCLLQRLGAGAAWRFGAVLRRKPECIRGPQALDRREGVLAQRGGCPVALHQLVASRGFTACCQGLAATEARRALASALADALQVLGEARRVVVDQRGVSGEAARQPCHAFWCHGMQKSALLLGDRTGAARALRDGPRGWHHDLKALDEGAEGAHACRRRQPKGRACRSQRWCWRGPLGRDDLCTATAVPPQGRIAPRKRQKVRVQRRGDEELAQQLWHEPRCQRPLANARLAVPLVKLLHNLSEASEVQPPEVLERHELFCRRVEEALGRTERVIVLGALHAGVAE